MKVKTSFNRTIVELKSGSNWNEEELLAAFNRTIVELKSVDIAVDVVRLALLIVP